MSRAIRYQPGEWSVFFVTSRYIHSHFLLCPYQQINAAIIGVLVVLREVCARDQGYSGRGVNLFGAQGDPLSPYVDPDDLDRNALARRDDVVGGADITIG